MKYHFRIRRQNSGYWAECIELKGCSTQAKTKAALLKNAAEALSLYLDEPDSSQLIMPLPKRLATKSSVIFEVPVEPRIACSFYIRQLRLRAGLTQAATAKLLGFKNLYSYQRLESSRTANPEYITLCQLKKTFKDFDAELLLAA